MTEAESAAWVTTEFMPCDFCHHDQGNLCASCAHNRAVIKALKTEIDNVILRHSVPQKLVRAQAFRQAAEWHGRNVQSASNFADAEYWRGIKYANEKAVEHFSALAEKEGGG